MKYKKIRSQFDTEPFDFDIEVKGDQTNIFLKANYEFLHVGNVHKNSILKDKKRYWAFENFQNPTRF